MAEHDSTRGPVPPYGPAIWDAVKRGDLEEMERVADAARLAIAKGAKQEGVEFAASAEQAIVHFHAVAHHDVQNVRSALSALEMEIAELRAARAKKDQPPPT
jgi:Asp-tRNA(Asn)/Glu-tRNA(Gln) amidotransferase C subunit